MGQPPEHAHTGKGLRGVDNEAYHLISYRNEKAAVDPSVVRFGKGVIGFKSRSIDLVAASMSMETPTDPPTATGTRPRLPQAHPLLLEHDGQSSNSDVLILSTCVIVGQDEKLNTVEDCSSIIHCCTSKSNSTPRNVVKEQRCLSRRLGNDLREGIAMKNGEIILDIERSVKHVTNFCKAI